MRDFVTTLLDATGLLLVAAGVAGGAWVAVGPWALSLGGGVVLGGSWRASGGTVNWKRLTGPVRRTVARVRGGSS